MKAHVHTATGRANIFQDDTGVHLRVLETNGNVWEAGFSQPRSGMSCRRRGKRHYLWRGRSSLQTLAHGTKGRKGYENSSFSPGNEGDKWY